MAKLSLPLWFVYERVRKVPTPNVPCDEPGHTMAFTTTDRVTAILAAGQSGQWKVNLVADSAELLLVLADLHHHGIAKVCLDPEPNGSGGELVGLDELMRFCHSRMPQGG